MKFFFNSTLFFYFISFLNKLNFTLFKFIIHNINIIIYLLIFFFFFFLRFNYIICVADDASDFKLWYNAMRTIQIWIDTKDYTDNNTFKIFFKEHLLRDCYGPYTDKATFLNEVPTMNIIAAALKDNEVFVNTKAVRAENIFLIKETVIITDTFKQDIFNNDIKGNYFFNATLPNSNNPVWYFCDKKLGSIEPLPKDMTIILNKIFDFNLKSSKQTWLGKFEVTCFKLDSADYIIFNTDTNAAEGIQNKVMHKYNYLRFKEQAENVNKLIIDQRYGEKHMKQLIKGYAKHEFFKSSDYNIADEVAYKSLKRSSTYMQIPSNEAFVVKQHSYSLLKKTLLLKR